MTEQVGKRAVPGKAYTAFAVTVLLLISTLKVADGITVATAAGELTRQLALADARQAVEDKDTPGVGVADGRPDGVEERVAADEGKVAAGGDVAAESACRLHSCRSWRTL